MKMNMLVVKQYSAQILAGALRSGAGTHELKAITRLSERDYKAVQAGSRALSKTQAASVEQLLGKTINQLILAGVGARGELLRSTHALVRAFDDLRDDLPAGQKRGDRAEMRHGPVSQIPKRRLLARSK